MVRQKCITIGGEKRLRRWLSHLHDHHPQVQQAAQQAARNNVLTMTCATATAARRINYGKWGETARDSKKLPDTLKALPTLRTAAFPAVVTSANPARGDRCACRRYVRFATYGRNGWARPYRLDTAGRRRVKLPMCRPDRSANLGSSGG